MNFKLRFILKVKVNYNKKIFKMSQFAFFKKIKKSIIKLF